MQPRHERGFLLPIHEIDYCEERNQAKLGIMRGLTTEPMLRRLSIGLLASALSNAFVQARPVQATISCAAPVTGQYLIVSQGLRGQQPIGSIQLETL